VQLWLHHTVHWCTAQKR